MNLIEVCDIIPKEEIAGLIAEYVKEDARSGDFFYDCLFDENVDNTSKIKNITEEDIYQYIAYCIDYRIEEDIMSTYEDELYSQSVYLNYDDIKTVMQPFIKNILHNVQEAANKYYNEHKHDNCFQPTVETSQELIDLDDSVGDNIHFTGYLGDNIRDLVICIINHQVIAYDTRGMTHVQVLNQWLKQQNQKTFDENFYRPDENDLDDVMSNIPVAFLNKKGGILLVDGLQNTTINEVLSDIEKSDLTYDKVYQSIGNSQIKRIAKSTVS